MRAFISHSRQNRRRALRLANAVVGLGIDVWYDEWEILVGHNLADQIYEGIRSSDFMLVVLTNASVRSKWVKEELDFAHSAEIERGGTRIVPVLWEDCLIPDALKTRVYADFRTSFEKGMEQLASFFRSQPAVTVSIPDSFYEIELPLQVYRMVTQLLPESLALKEGTDKEFVDYVNRKVEHLAAIADRAGVEKRYRLFINDLLSERVDTPDVFNTWFRGMPLYLGALEKQLPMISQLAFRIGRTLGRLGDNLGYSEDKPRNREDWVKNFVETYGELGFPQQFTGFIADPKSSFQQIESALSIEIRRLQDYRALRKFQEREAQASGLWAGFNCLYTLFLIEDSKEDNNASSTYLLGVSAEYIVRHLDDYALGNQLIDMALGMKKGDPYSRVDPLAIFASVRASARVKIAVSHEAKALVLGLNLGLLMLLEQDEVLGSLVHEIEAMAEGLKISEPLTKRLRMTLDRMFYSGDGREEIQDLLADLAKSIRRGESGVFAEVDD